MATYLVTGAAGFIGAKVSEKLIAEGHTIIGIDNINDAYDPRLKFWRLEQFKNKPQFIYYKDDICNRPFLEEIFNKHTDIQAVINLAARAGVRFSVENPWAFYESNLTGTLNLLDVCQRKGIKKFILASTSSIYGNEAPLPTPEEADSSRPLQPYAASKKAAETLCHSYHFLYGLDVTIFRFFTVYGPAGRPDMSMFRFVQWITEGKPLHVNGDGEQTRGFTYVDDIARGVIAGLRPLGYEIINLGGHETISINAMIAALEKKIGRKALIEHHPAHPADMLANWADVQKARRMLSWNSSVSLDQGMQALVDWYLAERSWACQVQTS